MTNYAVSRDIKSDPGRIWFSMEEVFSGPFEPMISKSIPDMTLSFEQFADGLKQAAEGG